jgi:hypothetical protein
MKTFKVTIERMNASNSKNVAYFNFGKQAFNYYMEQCNEHNINPEVPVMLDGVEFDYADIQDLSSGGRGYDYRIELTSEQE